MSDLISRSELIEEVNKIIKTKERLKEFNDRDYLRYGYEIEILKAIIDVISCRRTAYDIDKVVEELEADERHTVYGCINKRYAIEIVKQGGIGKVVE